MIKTTVFSAIEKIVNIQHKQKYMEVVKCLYKLVMFDVCLLFHSVILMRSWSVDRRLQAQAWDNHSQSYPFFL